MNYPSDEELLVTARENPESFGVLFDRYYQPIFSYVLKRTGKVALTQDIVSETFFRAFRSFRRFRSRGAPFSAWLYTIAIREIYRYGRRWTRYHVSLETLKEIQHIEIADARRLEEELVQAQDAFENHRQFTRIRQVIAVLPRKYQEVVTLRYFADKSIAEIAIILAKKEGTVKSLISRGLVKIRLEILST